MEHASLTENILQRLRQGMDFFSRFLWPFVCWLPFSRHVDPDSQCEKIPSQLSIHLFALNRFPCKTLTNRTFNFRMMGNLIPSRPNENLICVDQHPILLPNGHSHQPMLSNVLTIEYRRGHCYLTQVWSNQPIQQ